MSLTEKDIEDFIEFRRKEMIPGRVILCFSGKGEITHIKDERDHTPFSAKMEISKKKNPKRFTVPKKQNSVDGDKGIVNGDDA